MKRIMFNIFLLLSITFILFGCGNNKELKDFNYKKENGEIRILSVKNKTVDSLVVPEGVTSIGQYAFNGLTNLSSISLPKSLKEVDLTTFMDYKYRLYFDGTIEDWCNIKITSWDENIDSNASKWFLKECFSFREMFIIDEGGAIQYNGKKYILLEEVVIPSGITEIGDCQFSGFSNIKSITLPNTVTKIGRGAFAYINVNTTNITRPIIDVINIPNSVVEICDGAFYAQNVYIRDIYIPKSVTKIGRFVFSESIKGNIYYEGTIDEWNMIDDGGDNKVALDSKLICMG